MKQYHTPQQINTQTFSTSNITSCNISSPYVISYDGDITNYNVSESISNKLTTYTVELINTVDKLDEEQDTIRQEIFNKYCKILIENIVENYSSYSTETNNESFIIKSFYIIHKYKFLKEYFLSQDNLKLIKNYTKYKNHDKILQPYHDELIKEIKKLYVKGEL